MRSRVIHGLGLLGLSLMSLSCGQGTRPNEKAFFPDPQPLISGKAWMLPPHQGGDHHDEEEGHRGASLAGINLLAAPEDSTIHLTAVDAHGDPLSGSTEVTAKVGTSGDFEFFSLPNRCVVSDPQAKGCVVGASPNLLLTLGEGSTQMRAFVTFQKDEVIDPLTEATVQAITEGSKDLSHFGPTRLPQMLVKTREDLKDFYITHEMNVGAAATAMRQASSTLKSMTGPPPVTQVAQSPSTISPGVPNTFRLEALGYKSKDTCEWTIPGGQFVNSLVDPTVVDPHGACVVYVRLTLAQTTDFKVKTYRKLGEEKTITFKVTVAN